MLLIKVRCKASKAADIVNYFKVFATYAIKWPLAMENTDGLNIYYKGEQRSL